MNEEKIPKLNLPPIELKLRKEDDMVKVFDPLRNRFVALTPEEFVRQHFTAWLISDRHYPASMMANEVSIDVGGAPRRSDTVVFGPDGKPLVVVEYKAPTVPVTQAVFDQIAQYNMALRARYLIVSNGVRHYCCVMDHCGGTYHFIPHIPNWTDIRGPKVSEN